jgi:hypothetical protein
MEFRDDCISNSIGDAERTEQTMQRTLLLWMFLICALLTVAAQQSLLWQVTQRFKAVGPGGLGPLETLAFYSHFFPAVAWGIAGGLTGMIALRLVFLVFAPGPANDGRPASGRSMIMTAFIAAVIFAAVHGLGIILEVKIEEKLRPVQGEGAWAVGMIAFVHFCSIPLSMLAGAIAGCLWATIPRGPSTRHNRETDHSMTDSFDYESNDPM